MGSLIALTGLFAFLSIQAFSAVRLLNVFNYGFLFYFAFIEYQAITNRDLNKAEFAIKGFKAFMLFYLICCTIHGLSVPGKLIGYIVELLLGLGAFYGLIYYGANEVFQFLKYNKEGQLLKYNFDY